MACTSKRMRVMVLYGGRSAEHDVSVLSATNVMRALSPEKYDAVPVFVTRKGQWFLGRFDEAALARPAAGSEICLVPGGGGRILAAPADGTAHELPAVDIVFPVLHGLHGEDGGVQGLAEVACVPLAGCGILGSAAALDKDVAKRLMRGAGLSVARSITIRQADAPDFATVRGELDCPVFIKPARQGSSVGVSKVASEEDYTAALAEGFRHDRTLLAEEFIKGREIECGVLENPDGGLFISRPGEIAPNAAHGFYTYDAKYIDDAGAALTVPADLPPEMEDSVRETAGKAFRAVGCDGMARIDFFVTADLRLLVNEVNTIPGFTDISMYSKVMEASGVSYAELIDRLLAHGFARAERTRSIA